MFRRPAAAGSIRSRRYRRGVRTFQPCARTLAAVFAVLALTPAVGAGGTPRPVSRQGFRLPHGPAGCLYVPKRALVACWNSRLRVGFGLAASGEATALGPELRRWPLPARVLRSSAVWRRNGVACHLQGAQAMCSNASGAAVIVSRDAVAALASADAGASGGPG
jgi:hypothetical protein